LTVTLSSPARPVVLQLFGDEPGAVMRDGAVLTRLVTSAQFDAAETGWRTDTQARFILIKFQHGGGTTKVNL
jgi:hypothetical protein